MLIRISGGRIVDPAHGRDGIGDLCDKEYATLLFLELQPGQPPKLTRASYGAPDAAEATACQPMR